MGSHFSQKLLAWYDREGRKDLPWQKKLMPYNVWVSEIMLQQTQVSTVIPYYQRFMTEFPTLQSLANAPLDQVLHLWAGLGYYSRARNLHRTAIIIANEFHGRFPKCVDTLQQLPGIGRSTAGAIAAIAMKQKAPILDGNVKRVLTRYAAIAGYPGDNQVNKELWELAEALTPDDRTGDYTQAIMDLGATVCVRKKPLCHRCPVQNNCLAFKKNEQEEYPGKKPKKSIPTKAIYFLILKDKHQNILLEKRTAMGIWGGLWSLPECSEITEVKSLCKNKYYCQIGEYDFLPTIKHTFSHFHLNITPIIGTIQKLPCIMENSTFIWYNHEQIKKLGVAAPVKRLLQQIF